MTKLMYVLCPGCSEGKWEGGQPASACPSLSTSMSDNLSQQEICAMFTKDKNGCIFKLKAVLSILKRMKNQTYSKRSEDEHTFSRLPSVICYGKWNHTISFSNNMKDNWLIKMFFHPSGLFLLTKHDKNQDKWNWN